MEEKEEFRGRAKSLSEVVEVEISKIVGNPYQTRLHMEEEPLRVLMKSIRERGLFSPITLLRTIEEKKVFVKGNYIVEKKEKYIVVSGHRRLEACRRLKWKMIPAFVRARSEKNDLIIDLIHENLVREDLTVQEKALTVKLLFSQIKGLDNDVDRIISCITSGKQFNKRNPGKEARKVVKTKFTDAEMFQGIKFLKTIGMSANNAISYLTILKLPAKIQRIVSFNVHNDQGERTSTRISIRMAYNLARVDDEKYRDYLLERALGGCSARHMEALVNNYKLKVLKGEWSGFVKRFNNSKVIKGLDEKLFLNLSDECHYLAKKLNSFKATKLSALAETLGKEIFIASALDLKKELRLVNKQLDEKLVDKGYKDIKTLKENEPFEIQIKEMHGKKNCRGTIPMEILRGLGLDRGKLRTGSFVQVKIVGIRPADTKKAKERKNANKISSEVKGKNYL